MTGFADRLNLLVEKRGVKNTPKGFLTSDIKRMEYPIIKVRKTGNILVFKRLNKISDGYRKGNSRKRGK